MDITQERAFLSSVHSLAHPLNTPQDFDALLERIGDARYVLLGEASHGTAKYYTWRMHLSKRLIEEKGFSFIAVEGDWPDCYRVNRYVKGYPDAGGTAYEVLHAFSRWPTWMWANWEVVALTEWMRERNLQLEENQRAGFYGLDVYSLWESLEQVVAYLKDYDGGEALQMARRAYVCFQPYNRDVQSYAWATRFVPTSCEQEVVDLLTELRRKVIQTQSRENNGETSFNVEQNALAMVGAERYYRAMVQGGASSWNIRDYHMVETLERLMKHHGPNAKAIVWEHNTHIGDARATDMANAGMVNVGQLMREQHGDEGVVSIGFSSHRGSVIAAREWDAPMEQMPVPAAREGTWEDILHRALGADSYLILSHVDKSNELFHRTRGHRAIGVVYNPEYERVGNYVPTILSKRYDALIYLDETHALHPLHIATQEAHEPPETFPWAV